MTFHLTPDLVRAFRSGKISHDDLVQIVFEHLPAVCPHCRAGLTTLVSASKEPDVALLLGAFGEMLKRYGIEVEEAELKASRDLEELRSLSPPARRQRLLRAYRRFRGVSFVRAMLDEAQGHLHGSPAEAYHWAELAWVSAAQSPRIPADVMALSLAQMANARRAGGDLRSAEEHFQHVRYLVARHPVTDLATLAKILHFEGSLRFDQRKGSQARTLLRRATMLFELVGDTREIAQVLLTWANLLCTQGNPHRAIAKARRALELLDFRTDPELYLWARQNLAYVLVEDRQFEESALLLVEDASLYRQYFAPVDQLRVSWLEGRIAAGLNQLKAAESSFRHSRDGFLEANIGYPAAMVSLDLALLYAREGRTEELKRLAEEIAPVFSAHDVHREALAALLLFQEAARQETLTLTSLQALARYLRDAKNDPSLRFEPPAP